jgi:hypothetical protein
MADGLDALLRTMQIRRDGPNDQTAESLGTGG